MNADINRMAEAFCRWPLPKTVKPDLCAMDQDYPHRTGTNLLTFAEAKAMVEFILKEDQPPARQEGETPRTDEIAAPMWLKNGPATDEDLHVMTKLCRTLERELSAKQAEVDELKNRYGSRNDLLKMEEVIQNLRAELESLKAAQGWRPGKEFEDSFRKHVDSAIIAGEIDPETDTDYILLLIQGICADLPTPPVERSENKG